MLPAQKITAIPHPERGWMVSLRIDDGWRTFYGADVSETITRALANGKQTGDDMGDEIWQSRSAPADGPDDFPTQPWATRGFLRHVLPNVERNRAVWEPAANRGYMVRALQERFDTVIGSDYADYGAGFPVIDFLAGPSPADYGQPVHWIITNPPYNKALDFALRALDVAEEGVALLLRTQWLEGRERFDKLFSKRPPSYVAQYVERVGFDHGTVTAKGARQVPYCWLVWYQDKPDQLWPRLRWIPPCKKELEMENDYA